jgi:hypothetical protein
VAEIFEQRIGLDVGQSGVSLFVGKNRKKPADRAWHC